MFPVTIRHVHVRTVSIAVFALAVAAMSFVSPVDGETTGDVDPRVGSAGTDTRLPATDSQVTVSGRGLFENLRVTVNQTRNLVNQSVSVSWTGGKETDGNGNPFRDNYLQLMQCWGEDDGKFPTNPGPTPEQCVFGAYSSNPGVRPPLIAAPEGSRATARIVSQKDWPDHFDPEDGVLENSTGFLWKPFRAVDGGQVDIPFNQKCNPDISSCFFWLNTYFDRFTTNEIGAAATAANGTGSQLFEVVTGAELPGLGCGQLSLSVAGESPKSPKCWLVVVPRGDKASENEGVPNAANLAGIFPSPLSARAWANRIAIPLEFKPVESNCDSDAESRQLVGTELAARALSSWIPKLCARAPGAAPFAYTQISDDQARRQVVGNTDGPGAALVSRPVDPTSIDPENPVVYAPISLSSLVIGFNIDRSPDSNAPAEEKALSGVRVANINLTPRLVAKLLTQSYRASISFAPYEWAKLHPRDLGGDPDFLQFNPEFSLLSASNARNFSGFVMPGGKLDTARRLWEYVLADPEARSWLDGNPDPWGMKVNPVYSTNTSVNSLGVAFGEPIPDSFPKNEPYCHVEPPFPAGGNEGGEILTPPPYCGTDHMPYSTGFRDGARRTNLADDGAKVVLNTEAYTSDKIYTREGSQPLGSRKMLSLTDSASAARYGIQMASLSRPGDNSADRVFVAPDAEGMRTSMDAMVPRDEPAVVEPDLSAPGAYPLSTLTYAVLTPLTLSVEEREDYADFIEYAASSGQEQGTETGKLPMGYTPLSDELKAQAFLAAAVTKDIEQLRELLRLLAESPESVEGPLPIGTANGVSRPVAVSNAPTADASIGRATNLASTSPSSLASQPMALTSAIPDGTSAKSAGRTPLVGLGNSRYAAPLLAVLAILSTWVAERMARRARKAA